MFCVGAFALAAQVLFLREMLVVFLGNELGIGAIFAAWLLGIGAGATSARALTGRGRAGTGIIAGTLAWLLVLSACLLPVQVFAIRIARSLLHVPVGECASFGSIFAGALGMFLPTCFVVGMVFPLACHLLEQVRIGTGEGQTSTVSEVYTSEALGSMVGGILLTFVLLSRFSPLQIVLTASGAALAAAGLFHRCRTARPHRRRMSRILSGAALVVLAAGAFYPQPLRSLETWAVLERWRAFGVLSPRNEKREVRVRLRAARNTIYQNLALTESADQFTLYENGQVAFVFPDPMSYEHSVHFIMAQNPAARRVLVLGGNPVGDIPELLKYPLQRLVFVDLDPGVRAIVAGVVPQTWSRIAADRRLEIVDDDAPRFLRRCRERFDAIIVNAPEPTTAAANRFYTLEFLKDARRVLADDGFLYTAVGASERLQSEAAHLGASVYATLREMFPVVLVTAESRLRFLAGSRSAGLTFDRATLLRRSREAAIETKYFRPEYFLGADEITPEKTAFVDQRLRATEALPNTLRRPITYYYNLLLWGRTSGSGFAAVLAAAGKLRAGMVAGVMVMVGILLLACGGWWRRRRGSRVWSRSMVGIVMGTTGFTGMALEIVLILVFQSLYGYVYSRMGLIAAMFMLGLVVGAPCGRRISEGRRPWVWMVAVEGCLAMVALVVPLLVAMSASRSPWLEAAIYGAVACVGWAVGAEFPLGNRLYRAAGGSLATSASITDASDHFGAAAGSLIVGVLLLPVLGVEASCLILVALKVAGILCLVSGAVALPTGERISTAASSGS